MLIVASVGKSTGNGVETQSNTPDGISNDRTIRRPQPHGHCLDWEKPGRSAQPVAVSSSTGELVEGRVFESPAATTQKTKTPPDQGGVGTAGETKCTVIISGLDQEQNHRGVIF